MFKMNHRRACLEAIRKAYGNLDASLMADRLGNQVYYSVWRTGEGMLEALEYPDSIAIFEYQAAKK